MPEVLNTLWIVLLVAYAAYVISKIHYCRQLAAGKPALLPVAALVAWLGLSRETSIPTAPKADGDDASSFTDLH